MHKFATLTNLITKINYCIVLYLRAMTCWAKKALLTSLKFLIVYISYIYIYILFILDNALKAVSRQS